MAREDGPRIERAFAFDDDFERAGFRVLGS
jgi:predicted nucleic acid-binding protein